MLHIYTKKPPLKLRKLTEKYGNVFSLQIGSMWIVVVNGFHLVKEALVHQGKNFTDRPKAPVANEIFRKVSLPWTAKFALQAPKDVTLSLRFRLELRCCRCRKRLILMKFSILRDGCKMELSQDQRPFH
ncbi:cytochrome P450 2J2-like isoform X2 [Podarcis lilfordi]|uniref:Cytochrome P450 2J2-like isoform X2 n=1 Tax=Podarcis lilfordi TaxID=74358 RepID=A0AA35KGL0_9SAUR|nr:cytochrome P450 2J2-like isoform X2 [Podarcis lilfordi]